MIQMARVNYDVVQLAGGFDTVTPTLSLKPGAVRDGFNFECNVTGGYARIKGYERFDGHGSPSDATYTLITYTLTGSVVVGDDINGQTSGATATVIAITGSQLVVTKLVGTFQVGENLRVSTTVFGTFTSNDGFSSNALTSATYLGLAAAEYRSDIAAPTGSGALRGVIYFGGKVYAFRNNAGGTACDLWESSAAGWVAVSLGRELSFTSGGTYVIAEGDTITGATSSATAVITRVLVTSGTWAGGDAAGKLIFASQTGTFQSENLNVGANPNVATIGGNSSAITLSPDGRFEMVVSNFGGSTSEDRIYGCDGVNRGFEFDGSVFVPIDTGMSPDTPKHVIEHKNHLFFSFGPSIQFSSLGDPYNWTPILGAGEFNAGEDVTNFVVLPGTQSSGALLITTRNNTEVLYGSSASDFELTVFNRGIGALHYTAQPLTSTYALDDRGIVGLQASQNFGNFEQASLTANIRTFIAEHKSNAAASTVNRTKSQYRLFFSDGWGLYSTIVNDQYLGSLPVYFPNTVYCTWEGEDSDGNEVTFFGGADGMVYQLDKGTSHDGAAITSYITLNYNSIKSPRILKRFRKASAEITGNTYAQLSVSYSIGYGSTNYAAQLSKNYTTNFQGSGAWDSGVTWDSGMVWDGSTLIPTEIELMGTAENMNVTFANNSAITDEFTINSLIVSYSSRRGMR